MNRLEESDFDVFMKTAKNRLKERKTLLAGVEKDIDEKLLVIPRRIWGLRTGGYRGTLLIRNNHTPRITVGP